MRLAVENDRLTAEVQEPPGGPCVTCADHRGRDLERRAGRARPPRRCPATAHLAEPGVAGGASKLGEAGSLKFDKPGSGDEEAQAPSRSCATWRSESIPDPHRKRTRRGGRVPRRSHAVECQSTSVRALRLGRGGRRFLRHLGGLANVTNTPMRQGCGARQGPRGPHDDRGGGRWDRRRRPRSAAACAVLPTAWCPRWTISVVIPAVVGRRSRR